MHWMLLGAGIAFAVEDMRFGIAAGGESERGEAVVGSGKVRAMVRVIRKKDKEEQEEEEEEKKKKTEREARVAAMWRFDLCANFVPGFAGIPGYLFCLSVQLTGIVHYS